MSKEYAHTCAVMCVGACVQTCTRACVKTCGMPMGIMDVCVHDGSIAVTLRWPFAIHRHVAIIEKMRVQLTVLTHTNTRVYIQTIYIIVQTRAVIGHNDISRHYIGHSYIGHSIGHSCIGHSYIGPWLYRKFILARKNIHTCADSAFHSSTRTC